MRIAFSGTHRTGKSTLLEEVARRLPGHTTVEEPYHLLEEEGHEAAAAPTIEDFEAQLERSLTALADEGDDVLFDRCPADILAYLLTHDDVDAFDPDASGERIREAMATLDLVVFVPIEGRVPVPDHEDRAQRQAVHETLEALLLDDRLAGDVEVLVVGGDLAERVGAVMATVGRRAHP
jgi:predicted ATPase